MNRLTAGVFALLVVATFGAFFVAQRLKNAPPVLGEIGVRPVYPAEFIVVRISFWEGSSDVTE